MAQVDDRSFLSALRPAFEAGDARVESKAVEGTNVECVKQVLGALADQDYAAVGALLADDVEFEIIGSASLPMAGRTRGRDQVLEATRANFAHVDQQRPQIEAVVAQGDSVVIFAREEGRFKPTGRTYTLNWVQIYTVVDGRITRMRELLDTAALVEITSSATEEQPGGREPAADGGA
jgi:ketosteroid isomerase-like protein